MPWITPLPRLLEGENSDQPRFYTAGLGRYHIISWPFLLSGRLVRRRLPRSSVAARPPCLFPSRLLLAGELAVMDQNRHTASGRARDRNRDSACCAGRRSPSTNRHAAFLGEPLGPSPGKQGCSSR